MTSAASPTADLAAAGTSASLEAAGTSEQGPVRSENQDGWRVVDLGGSVALLVADGLGGHPGGREAAELAIDVVDRRLRAARDPHAALAAAFHAADRAIGADPAAGATTLVGAVVSGRRVTVANVGDSRAYLVGRGRAAQLTQDHSVVAEELRAPGLSPVMRRRLLECAGELRNQLTRSLFGGGHEVDLVTCDLSQEAVLMLCTDGLWGAVQDSALVDTFDRSSSLERFVEGLRDRALAGGSRDNVTVAACRRTPPTGMSLRRPQVRGLLTRWRHRWEG
jgi:PPM family protein phosphatase